MEDEVRIRRLKLGAGPKFNNRPTGIPVATVAVGGGDNAAYLAAQMLSIKYPILAEKLLAHRERMAAAIEADDKQIQEEL